MFRIAFFKNSIPANTETPPNQKPTMNKPILRIPKSAFRILFILSFTHPLIAQTEPEALKIRYEGNHRVPSAFMNAAVPATPVEELNAAIAKRQAMAGQSLLKNYPVRNIGPTVMSGRIVDVAVNEQNPKVFYVGYASGGVYKTVNNGNTLEPIFDHQRVLGVGDLALAPSNPSILWVGTGENNSSRSSYAGAGVYKSTDAGKTWQFMGLDFTQHVGRIAIHPQNPDVVWVAAIGSLYSTGKERGLYKTSDGGKTWKKTLFVDDSTGVIDVIVNPQNPNQLWAASWQRLRNAGNFVGNGNGTAIWISNDGGETWQRSMNGFPQGQFVGRIGLDVCAKQPNILYAILDNQEIVKKEKEKKKDEPKLKKDAFKTMTVEAFLALPNSDLDTFLLKQNFPKKYKAQTVKDDVRKGKYQPKALYDYFGEDNDANANLFNTSIKGAELYRSDDGGKNWKKVNEKSLDGLFYTYGYYFGQVRVSPVNPDKVFLFGVPMIVSRDGGKNFTLTDTLGRVHGDHHAMWMNPKDDDHLLNGNDGGLNISYDGGHSWLHANMPSVGQFYSVMVDMEKPYNVYGGLQDNGTFYGSSQSVPGKSKDWEMIGWGDGMMVAVDPRNSGVFYTGFQYGNYFKKTGKGRPKPITPKHDIGEAPLRWNWRTPLVMSPHNPDIIYMGSQRLHRSLDGAETWQTISPDLTKNKKQGNVPYSTLTVIAESPLKFGLIYVGTDDGHIQLTRDGGTTWQLVSSSLPQDLWVSSLFPSKYDEGTVYATLTGYRYDNFKSYVYKSTDYGKTWTSLSNNLPNECANVIVQDPVNQNLLYLGTDHGTYISLNDGQDWQLIATLPNVANYDMLVHPRDNELVIATHGRSMYVMDVKPLQSLKDGKQNQALVAFAPITVQTEKEDGDENYSFVPKEERAANSMFFASKTSPGITVEISDASGKVIRKLTAPGEAGIQFVKWDLKAETAGQKGKTAKSPVLNTVKPGEYKMKFTNGTATAETKVTVK